MSISDRLKTLRRQAGTSDGTGRGGAASVADRVARMGSAHRGRRGPGVSEGELAKLMGGILLPAGVIRVETRLPLSEPHGRWCLQDLCRVADALPGAPTVDPRRLLFIDTETTGLSGGSGTLAFMLGLAFVDGASFIVRQYLLSRFSGERAMLLEVADTLKVAHAVVSYNGKAFDSPLLAARYRLGAMPDPLSRLPHIDLLHHTRRAFGSRWPDCRLAMAERMLLQFARSNDLPGAEAPQAWFDYVREGEPSRLPAVLRHNRWDLVSLAVLLPALAAAHRDPEEHGADLEAVARALRKSGAEARALQMLWRNRSRLAPAAALELVRLLRRCGRAEDGLDVLRLLARTGDPGALEQLAKYHEHVTRDFTAALALARRLPDGTDSLRRRERLERKLSDAAAALFL